MVTAEPPPAFLLKSRGRGRAKEPTGENQNSLEPTCGKVGESPSTSRVKYVREGQAVPLSGTTDVHGASGSMLDACQSISGSSFRISGIIAPCLRWLSVEASVPLAPNLEISNGCHFLCSASAEHLGCIPGQTVPFACGPESAGRALR